MPVDFIEFQEARNAPGLRMVVVTGVPSPWSEAAKGILHVKGIPWKAVALDQSSAAMAEWAGERSGPVAIHEEEAPRSGWAEILMLAERLAPKPSLLPPEPLERARAIGVAHEICGEWGLGWTRRLQGVHAGLSGEPGFPKPVAAYLGQKYGYRADDVPGYSRRVADLLGMLAGLLKAQREAGSPYYFGKGLTAVDIYSATFMALFKPLPPEQCPMNEALRPGFESLDQVTMEAFDPVLVEHRDHVYAKHLELPLSI